MFHSGSVINHWGQVPGRRAGSLFSGVLSQSHRRLSVRGTGKCFALFLLHWLIQLVEELCIHWGSLRFGGSCGTRACPAFPLACLYVNLLNFYSASVEYLHKLNITNCKDR